MSTAVIGCGYWGKHYVRILSNMKQCAWAIDGSEAACAAMSSRYEVKCAPRAAIALADDSVKQVVIATPAHTHASVVRMALLAGKHVLVEKPLTLDSDSARELVELARGRGLTLMVGHTFLFNSRLHKLYDITHDPELFGTPRYITCRRTNLGPGRNDCSVLWDLAPHDVSILQALKDGMLPVRVSATGASVLPVSDKLDVAFVSIFYPDNTIAHVHVSWCDPHKVRQVTVIGSKMRVCFDDMDALRPITCFHQGVDVDPQNQERSVFSDGDIVIPKVDQSEPLGNQVIEFLSACTKDAQPKANLATDSNKLTASGVRTPSDGELGWAVVKIVEAAEVSASQGGKPIHLAWD